MLSFSGVSYVCFVFGCLSVIVFIVVVVVVVFTL